MPSPHGTESAYQLHCYHGQDPCGPCREAHREATRLALIRRRARLKAAGLAECSQCHKVFPAGIHHYRHRDMQPVHTRFGKRASRQ